LNPGKPILSSSISSNFVRSKKKEKKKNEALLHCRRF